MCGRKTTTTIPERRRQEQEQKEKKAAEEEKRKEEQEAYHLSSFIIILTRLNAKQKTKTKNNNQYANKKCNLLTIYVIETIDDKKTEILQIEYQKCNTVLSEITFKR